jgi:hypothetical protein
MYSNYLNKMDSSGPSFRIVAELPKTKKNLEEQKKKEEEERKREEERILDMKKREEHGKKKAEEDYENKKKIAEVEKRRQEEERRRQEEEQQRSTLEGRLAKLISDLNFNNTSSETTLSGIDMGPTRWSILAKALENNITLKELHLSRKAIGDEEGEEIIKSLKKNNTIEKLELQGNILGKNTAVHVGELLGKNDTLKYLDLEGNELFDKNFKDPVGIVAIAEGIKKNQCLILLNISNCNLDNECGNILADAMEKNQTIIDFDYRGNDFGLDIVKRLNKSLKRNKVLYDEERLMEWNERKAAKKEDEYNEMIDITLQREQMEKNSKL